MYPSERKRLFIKYQKQRVISHFQYKTLLWRGIEIRVSSLLDTTPPNKTPTLSCYSTVDESNYTQLSTRTEWKWIPRVWWSIARQTFSTLVMRSHFPCGNHNICSYSYASATFLPEWCIACNSQPVLFGKYPLQTWYISLKSL